MSDESATPLPIAESLVPVCGIGASAGGITALRKLFGQIPTDLGLAYVIVVHLSPDHPSVLGEILAACTRMPVHQVEDSPALRPNCVYVIPPDRELVISDNSIAVRPFTQPRGRRAPIDMLFHSIAAARGDGCAIVLSGSGSDGAHGVKAVKEAGGIVLVQEPGEAEYSMMPQNAIATGVADYIGPISDVAHRLVEIAKSKESIRSLHVEEDGNEVRRILHFLRMRTGHDFSSYKRATVLRRITRRMQITRRDSMEAYAAHIRDTPDEAKELFSDLLISVTLFFRDAHAFEMLAQRVIPRIFDQVSADGGIRAWVVGCATGEEAYSLAILFLEEAAVRRVAVPIQIFATDLDEGALATAREARYPKSIEADVSEERLRRWFVTDGSHYRIREEVREVVLFALHSALKDPPFMRLDLITCRNMLIYLERALQQQLGAAFHYALKPERFLFLGSAETLDATPELFTPIERETRIYQARTQSVRTLPRLPPFSDRPVNLPTERRRSSAGDEREKTATFMHIAALERQFLDGGEIDDAEARAEGELAAKPAEYRRLYEELKIAHERLNASRHEHELAVQDLRAANAELQSINEELQTVNAELKGKLESISSAHNDLQNLTTATEIGTLFLDTELRIRMFTPPVAELFNVYEADVGRSISNFTHQLKYDAILDDARRVLRDLQPFETVVENQMGRSFMMRLRPYRTLEDRIDGLVVTFVDVTARLQAEQQLRESEARYRKLFDSIDEGFCIVEVIFDTHGEACDYRFIEVNAAFERHTGLVDVVGKTVRTLVPNHETYWYQTYGRIVKTGVPERFESRAAALGRFYDGYAFPLPEPNRVGLLFRDISDRKQAEDHLKLMVDELNHRVKNTLAVVRSIARQTFKEGVISAHAESAFQGRLTSFAAAHNLLTRTHWSKTQLDEVVRAIVTSCSAHPSRYRIDGPTVVLTAAQAVSISMALHELCINAIKYGSLSVDAGHVEVSWQIQGDDKQSRVKLIWREIGGPRVQPPSVRGFGSIMVEKALAYELGGSVSVEYLPDGVVCTIEAPLQANLQTALA